MDVDGELVLDAADAAGVIVKINGTSQLSVIDGVIKPTTNNDVDLGTSSVQYKDAFFDGTVTTDVLTVDETATVATSLTVGGGATILTDAQIADDGNFTVDINGDITLDANGGEITLSDNNSATGKVIVDMDNTNIKHQYDGSNYVTTTLASTGSVTKETVGAGTTDSDYTLDVDGELVLDAADAAGVIMKFNGTSQVSVIDGVIKPTSNNDIDLGTSDNQFKNVYIAGNIDLEGNIDVNGTTNLDNTDIAGTFRMDGTTFDLDASGAVTIESSGAAISIGADDIDQAINIGTQGERTLSIGNGAFAQTIGIGNATGATAVTIAAGTGDLALTSTDNITLVATDIVSMHDGTATFSLAGTGATALAAATTVDLDATGAMTMNSSAGTISIGDDDIDQAINIGTQGERTLSIGNGAFAQTIGIGNATGATAVTIAAGTGDLALTSTDNITLVATDIVSMHDGTATFSLAGTGATALAAATTVDLDATGAMTMNSSAGTISIADDNVDQNVNLATGGTRTLAIGINDGTDVTTITSRGNQTHTGTITVGVDGTGHDVKFFGATAGAYIEWDETDNELRTAGAAVVDIVKDKLLIGGTAVTTTAAELNLLDNVSGLVQADLTKLAAVDATAAEINILDASAATAVASDVASSSGALTSNNYSISHTLTLAGTLADDAVHADVTITSNKVLATSVIIANASIGAEVDIHTVVAGSFKVSIKNVSGSTLADDSTIIINYRVI